MQSYFFKQLLLPTGWAENVRLQVSEDGLIDAIDIDSEATAGDRLINQPAIPAMPNCHSHAFQRALAGLTEFSQTPEDSFWSWRQLMYQFLGQLGPEEVAVIARQLYVEMLKAGYCQVGEFHYLHHDIDGKAYADPAEMSMRLAEAATDVDMGLTLLPVLYRYASFGKQAAGDGQRRFIMSTEQFIELHQQLKKRLAGQVIVGAAPHSLRAVDIKELQEVVAQLDSDTPIHIHIAEQLPEVQQSLEYSGQRPVEYLYNNLEVDSRWTLVHATHLNEDEIANIASSRAVVGLCPTTEANLGDGIIDLDVFSPIQPAVWAIGSDSHISVDSIEELRLLEYGERLTSHRRAVICHPDQPSNGLFLWQQAVAGGSQSTGVDCQLKVGGTANWITLNNETASLAGIPTQQLMDAAILSNRPGAVIKDVYRQGRQVISDGHHPQEEKILSDFVSLMKHLLKNS